MKKLILVMTISAWVLSVYAQPDEKAERIKQIKLEKYEFNKALPAPVKGIDVLVSLWDSTRLGYVQVGLANKKIRALPATDYHSWLQNYISEQYEAFFTPSGKQVLCVIRDLRINERTFVTAEKAFVRLQADGYVVTGDRYQYVCSIDTVLDKGGMSDVTQKHGKHIAESLHLLLCAALNHAATDSTTVNLADIRSKTESRFTLPILISDHYPKGVYLTFEEFKNNAPSVADFNMKKVKGKLKMFRVDNGAETEINNFWGLCQNNELYKWHSQELVPLEKIDHTFIVSTYLKAINRKNKAIFWGAIGGGVGGIAGAGIAGAAAGSAGEHVYNVSAYPHLKRKPEASSLDMQSGELTF